MSPLAKTFLSWYEAGDFPMADPDGQVARYSSDPRGILPLSEFHIPRRLQRWLPRQPYTLTHNRAFREVMEGCASRKSTWISTGIIDGFCQLHCEGYAHSLEAWLGDELVGGLYGLCLGGTFCGESMFSRADHASKVCLVELARRLQLGGFELIDCQSITPTLRQFGARWVDFATYFRWFQRLRSRDCHLGE